MLHSPAPAFLRNPYWVDEVFSSKAAARGGVVRRAVLDVEREVGRASFVREVRRRGFHLVECGGQFVIFCNTGQIKILC